MVPTRLFARFGPADPVSAVLIAPVEVMGTGSTAVAGAGLAATVAEMTRSTVSTDWVVKLVDTTTVVGFTPAAWAAPKCERASPHKAFRRVSVMLAQVFASALLLMVA